jgi:apolipoprotein N-acyltransferase
MKILRLPSPTVVTALPVASRWSWLWLVIGAALLPFTSIQPSLAIAAWLAPVFLLRFARTQRARVGLPLIALVQSVALGVNWYIGSIPNTIFALIGVGIGLLATLAYVADRLLTPHLRGLTRILVFPLALTTIDWLGSLLAPALTPFLLPSLLGVAGAWDSPGYTQASVAPLVQLVSITGMWGLTFLLAWFASTANALWEHSFDLRRARVSLVAFGAICGAVLIFGVVRMAAPIPATPTVSVAAIASREDLFATISDLSPGDLMPGTALQRANARAQLTPIADDLFARTERAAQNGARIITWGETGAPVLEEDAPALIARAARIARQRGIYLQVGMVVFRNTDHYPFLENRAVLLDSTGTTAWDYHKAHPTPGENVMIAAGPRTLPVIDTPYGRLAIAICYDVDFPDLIRQAGQADVDILLAPYKDWESIRVQHAQMAIFRAVENGLAIVRPSLSGISTIIDAQGRVLAQADAFGPSEPTAVADVATQHVTTFYARFGDWFAYLCIANFAGLIVTTLLRRTSQVVAPRPASPL